MNVNKEIQKKDPKTVWERVLWDIIWTEEALQFL